MPIKSAGFGPGERRLNGVQTTGRDYRNLSEPAFGMRRTNDVEIEVRDGTVLMADLFRPDADGRFPALVSFSPYPRQIQDVGAPLGFIEAGASDFFVPRGYAHLIVNARGTGGSGGAWGFFDGQERDDLHDLVEWAAAQPWCDGNVGMLGISYFAMAQLAAAVTKPPHLKAIAPLLTTDDLYEAAYHHGLLNAGFISAWLPAIGVMSEKPDAFWRGARLDLARAILRIPAIHARMQHINGEAIVTVLKDVIRAHPPRHYDDLWRAVAVEHPVRDAFWDERNVRPLLEAVDIPVYLGADWDNVPLHLPSTFGAWQALRHNPNVRMATAAAGRLRLALGGAARRGARLVRPLAQGPRHRRHGRPADPLPGARAPRAGAPPATGHPPRRRSRPSPCAPTAASRPRRASRGSANTSTSRPIPASRATPTRRSCRRRSPGRRRSCKRPWSSPATSNLCSRRRSPLSTRAGSPSSTTCRRKARPSRSPPGGSAQASPRWTRRRAPLAPRFSIAGPRPLSRSASG